MVFSSNIFLCFFLPIFLILYYLTPRNYRNYTLLLFSLVFYAFGAPDFVLVLVVECIINYFLVKGMVNSKKKWGKIMHCTLSVVSALDLLIYYKYASFLMGNLNAIFTWFGSSALSPLNTQLSTIVLPIGISFFTFQSITYTLDVYRGVTPPSKKLTDYVLYIMMFPQLIAGPIVNYNTVAKQLVSRESTMENRTLGFYRFVIGLSKKVLIANTLALYADQVFGLNSATLSTGAAWLGILSYTLQIYFDFSGYSDMAIGLGTMMGFRFPENFNNPYTSRSVTEFWKRWHMTLGNFIMNYLYIPLGGNRKGKGRTYLNLWICFLLSGLWHGASWNFVLWGAFHGFFIVLEKIIKRKKNKPSTTLGATLSLALTFFIVMMGWVLFRADNLAGAGAFYAALFSFKSGLHGTTDPMFWTTLAIALLFSFITLSKGGQKLQDAIFAEHYSKRLSWIMFAVTLVLLLISIGALCVSDFNPFIYFRF